MTWAVPAAVVTSTTAAASWGTQVRDNFTMLDTMLTPASQWWVSFTVSSISQSVSVSGSVTRAKYRKVGRIVEAHLLVSITGAGTAGTAITVNVSGLPAALDANAGWGIGICNLYDSSAGVFFNSGIRATTAAMTALTPDFLGATPSVGLANADTLTLAFRYESAS